MADQEIDEQVARKLGFVKRIENVWSKAGPLEKTPTFVLPDYCHSIEASWELIPYFKKWSLSSLDDGEICFSWINECGDLQAQRAATPSMAICLAFLKLP